MTSKRASVPDIFVSAILTGRYAGGTPSAGLTRLGHKARESGYATWTPYPSLAEHVLLMRSGGIAD